eukprot:s1193_g5.t1
MVVLFCVSPLKQEQHSNFDAPWEWLPSAIHEARRGSPLPRKALKSVNKELQETAYDDSFCDLNRWVDRNFNASRHCFLARGKAEAFSEDREGIGSCGEGGVGRKDCRSFTKRQRGSERYVIAFTAGELSRADGVGIIFSLRLPRSSDIQKIISVFLNRTGRICSRINQRVTRIASSLPQIEVGDILEVVNNLDMNSLTFTVWTKAGHEFTAAISYSEVAIAMGYEGRPVPGHLAVVVKNPGVSVSLFSVKFQIEASHKPQVQQHKAEALEGKDYRFRLMEIKGDISQRVDVVRQVHSALENRGRDSGAAFGGGGAVRPMGMAMGGMAGLGMNLAGALSGARTAPGLSGGDLGTLTLQLAMPNEEMAHLLSSNSSGIARRAGVKLSSARGAGGLPVLKVSGTAVANSVACYLIQDRLFMMN